MSDRAFPFDSDTRQRVAELLYAHLPAVYRVWDDAGDLRRFLEVLGAPLAVVRQNIEELHSDLFIDTCGDAAIPLLAEMVGTTLVFPDADSNRRDVRGTVAWRRRKGTPATLQDLGQEISAQLMAVMEGWKRLALTQDLNLLRRERAIVDLGSPLVAETADGPLDAAHHIVDVRHISARTGRYHPRHVTHYQHPTKMFPVREGTAAAMPSALPGSTDHRFAVHPAGRYQRLRVRRADPRDSIRTDIVPTMHFAIAPADWFGVEGRFDIRLCGLLGGVADDHGDVKERDPSRLVADTELCAGGVSIELLARPKRNALVDVDLTVCAVELSGLTADTGNPAAVDERSRLTLSGSGTLTGVNTGPVATGALPMLRLTPASGSRAFFPGATVALGGGRPQARQQSSILGLAQEGFLRGHLVARIPATWVMGERWFYVAGDGSLYEAQRLGSGVADVALESPGLFDADQLASTGPGAAWPPLPPTARLERFDAVVPSPGRGPTLLHGCRALAAGAGADVGAAVDNALVFAARYVDAGVPTYRPVARLAWSGPDAGGATWDALDDSGAVLPASAVPGRFADLAAWRAEGQAFLRLVARFESSDAGVVCVPGEVVFTGDRGETVLVHLPQLTADNTPPTGWPTTTTTHVSDEVSVAVDGATWWESGLARMAAGDVAPLAAPAGHRRRAVTWRTLCNWRSEATAGVHHAFTAPGRLDVDPAHGLFALAPGEPPPTWAMGPEGAPLPAAVTVVYQEGYSDHTGARTAAREPELNLRQPKPTRIVARNGVLHPQAPLELHTVPRYRSLTDAFAAIAAAPQTDEVVQFEDSATYPAETPVWPDGCDALTVQAAERERPVIELDSFAGAPSAPYRALTLRGIAFGRSAGAPAPLTVAVPPSSETRVALCSITDEQTPLSFVAPPEGADIELQGVVAAGLEVAGAGRLAVRDSVIDGGGDPAVVALQADDCAVVLERVTVVGGAVLCRVLYASETIFAQRVEVQDQFHGCVRFSRAPVDAVLPRKHRVVRMPPRFVSVDRHDPAHARLSERCDVAIVTGAEDGSEMGAFKRLQNSLRREGLMRRLREYTPAGLATGLIRVD